MLATLNRWLSGFKGKNFLLYPQLIFISWKNILKKEERK
jgi:hypothetical protein